MQASRRTELLEGAIEKMVAKLDEHPSTPYTENNVENLSGALNALRTSREIDREDAFAEQALNPSRMIEVVVPQEIADFILQFEGWTQQDIRFHAAGIEMKANELASSYALMLQRSRPIGHEPDTTQPVDPEREKLAPGDERKLYDAMEAAITDAEPPQTNEAGELVTPIYGAVETPVDGENGPPYDEPDYVGEKGQ